MNNQQTNDAFRIGKVVLIFMMRAFILLFCTTVFGFSTAEIFSQKTKVYIAEDQELSVDEVFDILRNQTDYTFIYQENLFRNTPSISVKKGSIRANKLLEKCFSNNNFQFELNGSKILIRPLPKETPVMQISVSGVISDSDGRPLPGANIVEKGTGNGVQSDFDGKYSIQVADNATLVISYIGFATQEISVAGQTEINVTLQEDAAGLEEVIVIGYGTVRKSDLTGSVSKVDSEETFAAPVANLDQALQGRASGVQVTTINGAPGSGATIRIRGGNSITAGNEPLYVIDGFIGGGDLTTINPNDIASIEILKDASSTAIYGSRGANGVILITTKKGATGKTEVSFRTSMGIQSLPNKVDVQNAAEFATYINTANPGQFDLNNLPGGDTDWQEEMTRSAIISDHQLSASGGTEKTQYYVSAGILSQEGILIGSDFERFTLRTNIDNQLAKNLKWGTNIALSRAVTNNTVGTSNLIGIIRADPMRPVYDEEGNFTIENVGLDNDGPNLVANALLNTNKTTSDRILLNNYIEFKIADKFTMKSTLGGDFGFVKNDRFTPATNPESILAGRLGRADVNQSNRFEWLNENTINYAETLGDHSVGALVGYTIQQATAQTTSISADEIPSDGVTVNALELAPIENVQVSSGYSEFALQSFLARVNYGYKGKYLFTASIRRDGSSRLGANNRYATFPSAAVAWRISDEGFLENSAVVNNLKLRASYGLTGNQGVNPFSTLSTLSTGSTAILAGGLVVGAQQGALANPDLKWETTAQFDVGLEFGLFNSRITGEIDYYYKKTEDLLLAAEVPAITGFASILRNVGSLENRGIDLSLTGKIIATEDIDWSATINISQFKNEVLDLGEVDFITTSSVQGTPRSQLIVGEPVGTFTGAVYDGVDPDTGDAIYRDISGDGEFDPADDLGVIGNANPDFYGGFTNTFRYKNFDLQAFFQFSSGNDLYNTDMFQVNGAQLNSYAGLRAGVWSADNPNNATIPRIGSASLNRSSSLFLQDGSFLRFRTLQIGYAVPTDIFNGLASLRIFATGNNLFLIKSDDYLGFDPDVNSNGTSNTLRGFDSLAYPQNRSIIIGAEISF